MALTMKKDNVHWTSFVVNETNFYAPLDIFGESVYK